jgi:hypothetical protein
MEERGDVSLGELPDGQFPFRVGDGDEMQVTRLVAQQPVTLGYHLVPVAAACEPTAGAARRGGTEIWFTLSPFCVVLQLTGTLEPPGHLLLSYSVLLRGLKVRET